MLWQLLNPGLLLTHTFTHKQIVSIKNNKLNSHKNIFYKFNIKYYIMEYTLHTILWHLHNVKISKQVQTH